MIKSISLTVCSILFVIVAQGQEPVDTTVSTFRIYLSTESCNEEPEHEHAYSEKIDSEKGLRIIDANGIPSHNTGQFPNIGNPNTIKPQKSHYEIPLIPVQSETKISAKGKRIGILFSGVEVDPFTNEFFEGKRRDNHEWNYTTLTSAVNLGLDCNNAHVQPGGKYHYHGTPNALIEELEEEEESMIKIGYAADGYPIYYKYGFNDDGELIELESSYALKEGERLGDGKKAPDGAYDGTYFQDYEFKEGLSELDECNGRIGKTPESENEYYYVITDNFPSSPICFSAIPSEDFINPERPRNGRSNADPGEQNAQIGQPGRQNGPSRGEHSDPSKLMEQMDTNRDGKISKSEAKGPMAQQFDKIDTNNDGFITSEELSKMQPPRRK